MKARFMDEQIIAMVTEQEAGEKTADVCRRHGIGSATFYKHKSKYGGMEPSVGFIAQTRRGFISVTQCDR